MTDSPGRRFRMVGGLVAVICVALPSACTLPDVKVAPPAKRDATRKIDASKEELDAGDDAKPAGDSRAADGGAAIGGSKAPKAGASARERQGGSGGAPGPAGSGGAPSSAAGSGGGDGTTEPADPVEWSAPEPLDTGTTDAYDFHATRNSAGELIVSWRQDEPSGYLWVRRFVRGAWDEDTLVISGATNPGMNGASSRLGLGSTGDAALFLRGRGDTSDTFKPFWVDWGSGMSPPTEAKPSPVVGEQVNGYPVAIVSADAGPRTAVWFSVDDPDGMSAQLWLNTRTGSEWATPMQIGVTSGNGNLNWMSTSSSKGDFLVTARHVPQDSPNDDSYVFDTFMRVGEEISTAKLMLPRPSLSNAQVTLDQNGEAVALFRLSTYPADEPFLYASTYTKASKTWSTPEALSSRSVLGFTSEIAPDGTTLATWYEYGSVLDSNNGRLVQATFANGAWSKALLVADQIELSKRWIFNSSINSAGTRVFVWTAQTSDRDGHQELRYLRYTAANGWEKVGVITKYFGEIVSSGLSVAEDGRALIVWTEAERNSSVHHVKWSRSK